MTASDRNTKSEKNTEKNTSRAEQTTTSGQKFKKNLFKIRTLFSKKNSSFATANHQHIHYVADNWPLSIEYTKFEPSLFCQKMRNKLYILSFFAAASHFSPDFFPESLDLFMHLFQVIFRSLLLLHRSHLHNNVRVHRLVQCI